MTETIPEAEHVFIRGEGGAVFKLDLPLHESVEERLLKGYLVRVADAEGNPYVEGGSTIAEPPAERPTIGAGKKVWVGWAVAESARRGNPITPDAAEALTKDDLIERYGTTPAAAPAEPDVTDNPDQPAIVVLADGTGDGESIPTLPLEGTRESDAPAE